MTRCVRDSRVLWSRLVVLTLVQLQYIDVLSRECPAAGPSGRTGETDAVALSKKSSIEEVKNTCIKLPGRNRPPFHENFDERS